MSYTSAATTEIAKEAYAAEYKVELRPTGGAWATFEYVRGSFSLEKTDDDPKVLGCQLVHVPVSSLPSTGDAGHLYHRTSDDTLWHYSAGWIELPKGLIGCDVRATSYLGSESDIEFLGEVVPIEAADFDYRIKCLCRIWRLQTALAQVTNGIAPQEVVVCGASPRRELTLINNGQYGETYGLTPDGGGTDPGFDVATQLIPRSWADQSLRIWKHATDDTFTNSDGNLETYELGHDHWREDLYSGALTIIEAEPQASYWAAGLGAFEETQLGAEATTNGRNADFARMFEQAIRHPKARGGRGVQLGGEWGSAITDADTGADTFTIDGDCTRWFKAGGRIYVQGSTGNDGSYSIDSVTLSSGDTVIAVNEAVPDATADGFVTLDTGLDMPGIFTFPEARLGSLLERFRSEFQSNIVIDYDYALEKFYLRVVEQKEAGSVDWALIDSVSIGRPTDGSLIKTGVQFSGRKARPLNIVEKAIADGTLVDISTGSPPAAWFGFNGQKIEGDAAFADLKARFADGNATLGVNRHNLDTAADIDAGSTPYAGWYLMTELPIDPEKAIQRIEIVAPASRNPNAANGDQRIVSGGDARGFHPGLRMQTYDPDLNDWYDTTPLIHGYYEPHSTIDVSRDDIARPFGTKVRLLGGAYKHGTENQDDPSVGVSEWRVYQDIDYAVKASISPMHPIVAVVTGVGGRFSISGNFLADFAAGDTITVRDNTGGGDGSHTLASVVTYDPVTDRTTLTTTTNLAGTVTASGELYTTTDYVLPNGTTVQRDYPDLWDRFDGLRWESRDLGDQYDEPLAKQLAILELDDRLRMYQQVSFTTQGPDPRIRQWDTVSVTDEINGDVTTLLVRSVTKTEEHTVVTGTNYRSGALGT